MEKPKCRTNSHSINNNHVTTTTCRTYMFCHFSFNRFNMRRGVQKTSVMGNNRSKCRQGPKETRDRGHIATVGHRLAQSIERHTGDRSPSFTSNHNRNEEKQPIERHSGDKSLVLTSNHSANEEKQSIEQHSGDKSLVLTFNHNTSEEKQSIERHSSDKSHVLPSNHNTSEETVWVKQQVEPNEQHKHRNAVSKETVINGKDYPLPLPPVPFLDSSSDGGVYDEIHDDPYCSTSTNTLNDSISPSLEEAVCDTVMSKCDENTPTIPKRKYRKTSQHYIEERKTSTNILNDSTSPSPDEALGVALKSKLATDTPTIPNVEDRKTSQYYREQRKCQDFEEVVDIFKPLIVNNLLVTELLPYMSFLDDQYELKVTSRRSPREGVVVLLNELKVSKDFAKWRQFLNALSRCGYEYILQNIRGYTFTNHRYQEDYLKSLSPKLSKMIRVRELLQGLYAESIISQADKEEIEKEETNFGNLSAACMLLNRIPRKIPNWYTKFIAVLRSENFDDIANDLDIPQLCETPKVKATQHHNVMLEPALPPRRYELEHDEQVSDTVSIQNDRAVSDFNEENTEDAIGSLPSVEPPANKYHSTDTTEGQVGLVLHVPLCNFSSLIAQTKEEHTTIEPTIPPHAADALYNNNRFPMISSVSEADRSISTSSKTTRHRKGKKGVIATECERTEKFENDHIDKSESSDFKCDKNRKNLIQDGSNVIADKTKPACHVKNYTSLDKSKLHPSETAAKNDKYFGYEKYEGDIEYLDLENETSINNNEQGHECVSAARCKRLSMIDVSKSLNTDDGEEENPSKSLHMLQPKQINSFNGEDRRQDPSDRASQNSSKEENPISSASNIKFQSLKQDVINLQKDDIDLEEEIKHLHMKADLQENVNSKLKQRRDLMQRIVIKEKEAAALKVPFDSTVSLDDNNGYDLGEGLWPHSAQVLCKSRGGIFDTRVKTTMCFSNDFATDSEFLSKGPVQVYSPSLFKCHIARSYPDSAIGSDYSYEYM